MCLEMLAAWLWSNAKYDCMYVAGQADKWCQFDHDSRFFRHGRARTGKEHQVSLIAMVHMFMNKSDRH